MGSNQALHAFTLTTLAMHGSKTVVKPPTTMGAKRTSGTLKSTLMVMQLPLLGTTIRGADPGIKCSTVKHTRHSLMCTDSPTVGLVSRIAFHCGLPTQPIRQPAIQLPHLRMLRTRQKGKAISTMARIALTSTRRQVAQPFSTNTIVMKLELSIISFSMKTRISLLAMLWTLRSENTFKSLCFPM